MTVGPGIHELTMRQYLAHPAYSRSVLVAALRSPAEALAAHRFDTEITDAMRLGTATHMCVYEQEQIPLEFALWRSKDSETGKRKNRTGADWEAFKTVAIQQDKDYGLTDVMYQEAQDMAAAIRAHPDASKLLARKPSRSELTMIYRDEETGLMLKIRQIGRASCRERV